MVTTLVLLLLLLLLMMMMMVLLMMMMVALRRCLRCPYLYRCLLCRALIGHWAVFELGHIVPASPVYLLIVVAADRGVRSLVLPMLSPP